ncbi:hypothetical protein [Pseudactinotalea sp. HY158]|uniref:hypothetical protein n=1 Tax=Pseudactinotalea sp. HY158 TaxID=2654547 RepID=UPI00129C17FC|nr:hypothetical protein [Pseudactinotalea sp. HY158]QGH69116.1 hypothetical protein GCE65_06045 [Pseudactinotalea sp. HY158]
MIGVEVDYAALTGHCGTLDARTSSFDEIRGATQTCVITSNLAFGLLCSPFFLPVAAAAQGGMLAGVTAVRYAVDGLSTDVGACRDDTQRSDNDMTATMQKLLMQVDSRGAYSGGGVE